MRRTLVEIGVISSAVGLFAAVTLTAQPPGGPGGFGGPPGGFGGPPGGQTRKILKEFDKDGNGWLDAEERKAARAKAKEGNRRPGGFGGFGRGRSQDPPKPGAKVEPGDVPGYPGKDLYDPAVLRTVFLRFEEPDWESELEDFHGTDVDVAATLTVDGKTYPNVGVHFRGMSSYMGVGAGFKRSLNVGLDLADPKQRLLGAKTLNLLNAHEDPSFLSTVLYSHVARQYTPAPKANLVRVVINGESWGVYTNVQQFDKAFLEQNYKTAKGTRWKVRGSPGGGGGLEYLGDELANYKRRYEMKGGENEKAWKALVQFCKVLNETPADKLEAALRPICDIDGLLWFLALDVALINGDGYWIRASDYSIYLDDKGKFHFVPHDMNEAFHPAMGPGMGGPPGGGRGPGGRGPGGGGPGGPGGPPGGFAMTMPFPRPGDLLPGPLQDALGLTDEQKRRLAELQKEADGKLDKLLTDAQRKQWKEMRERGPVMIGFGPPAGIGSGGVELDPLVGLTDRSKPLRSKVLAVPALRAQYLRDMRTVAEKSLDWKTLGPVVARYRAMIEKEIEADTRKLEPTEAFLRVTADDATDAGRGREYPLRAFADARRKFLLGYKEKEPAK
jgi:spore coat protein CotH